MKRPRESLASKRLWMWAFRGLVVSMIAAAASSAGAETAPVDETEVVPVEDMETSVRFSLSEGVVISMPDFPRRQPRSPDAAQERMMAIYQDIEAENWASAIRALRPILREEPENMGLHTAAVFVLDQMNRHREAIGLLERMIDKFPEDYRVLNNLAWVYATADEHDLRNVDRAFDLVRDAVLRAPGDYRVWSTLAECYYISGDFERAQDTMAKTIEMAVNANADPRDLRQYRERLMRYRQANAVFRLQS